MLYGVEESFRFIKEWLRTNAKKSKSKKKLKRVTKRYLIITEDTPQNGIDDYFCKLHAGSDWGKCKSCFLSAEEWSKLFTEKYGLKIVKRIDVSRYEYPFADKPFIYPVPATTFVLQT